MSDWNEGSKLDHVRKRLGVSSKENERPYKVAVLNKTASEMADELGYTSFYISREDEFIIVFNRDYHQPDSIEHEYAHSQSDGMSNWYQRLLFRGVNEALTESSTSTPQSYRAQREFLNQLLHDHPEYEDTLYEAYVGNEESRTKIFSEIIKDYGVEGFLTFARVAPIDNPKMSGNIGKSIYIDPNQALKTLTHIARSSESQSE